MPVKKYFTYVSTVQSVLVNMFLGYILAQLILEELGIKSIYQTAIALPILIIVLIVGNFILYRICKRVRRIPLEFAYEKQWIRQGIKVVVICFLPIIFLFILFILLIVLLGGSPLYSQPLP